MGNSKSGYPNPKTDCALFRAAPKMDHETIKSTLWVDYSDRFEIQHFEIHDGEIHNLSVFSGKDLKKVFLTSGFLNKNV